MHKMATVKINPSNRNELRKQVKRLLERRWAVANTNMIEVARKHGYASPEKFSQDVFWETIPGDIREFYHSALAFRATQPDRWKDSIVNTTNWHLIRLPLHSEQSSRALSEVKMKIASTKSFRLPNIEYTAASDLRLSATSPLYLPALEIYRAYSEVMDSNEWIIHRIGNFIETRSTYGQVRRDWPTLISFLGESYTVRLGTTVARGKPILSDAEASMIAAIDPILLETMFRPECDSLNLRFQ